MTEEMPNSTLTCQISELHEPRPSISDSYDPDVGEGVAITLRKVEPATNLPLRVRVRKIASNKFARRTFVVGAIALIVTIVYNNINLVPAFQGISVSKAGLEIQGKSEANGREGLTQGFLSECRGRKVRIITSPKR